MELRLSCTNPSTRWCHDMEVLSALLALCEGNPFLPSTLHMSPYHVHKLYPQGRSWNIQLVTVAQHGNIWWCHDMEVLSALPALCEGNPLPFLHITYVSLSCSHAVCPEVLMIHTVSTVQHGTTWWCHDMEMLSALLTLSEGNKFTCSVQGCSWSIL